MKSAIEASKQIQAILQEFFPDVAIDGDIGKRTRAAIEELDEMADQERIIPAVMSPLTVKASFFAGPQDVSVFRECKANGGSDQYCFSKGDNGIGAWGADCTRTDQPMVALPREVWRSAGKKGGAKVAVTYKGKKVYGVLGDTMPSLANIKNGCGIDLNPGYAVAFGIEPSQMNNHTLESVAWEWA